MKIRVDDKYTIYSDTYCTWITIDVVNKTSGKVYERVFNGYHRNLEDCLKSFVSKRLNASDAQTLIELSNEIIEIKKDIKEFFRTIQANSEQED